MSLLARNKNRWAAEAQKFSSRHSILKLGADRNVRDAYLHGLVFATVANDDRIDDREREQLQTLGASLNLSREEIAGIIECLKFANDEEKMTIIEECAHQLSNVKVSECFLKEFEELWFLGNGDRSEYEEFRPLLVEWMGEEVEAAEAIKSKSKKEVGVSRCKAGKKRREEKTSTDIQIGKEYQVLRAIAHRLSDRYGKRISREVYSEIRIGLSKEFLRNLDIQNVFHEVGRRFVLGVQSLKPVEANELVRDSAWTLIVLSVKMVVPGELPVRKTLEMLSRVFMFDASIKRTLYGDYVARAARSVWGDAAGGAGVLSDCAMENWFCELTGAEPVWRRFFTLTEQQISKLQWWIARNRSYDMGRLERYAHSVGVSELCSGPVIQNMIMSAKAKQALIKSKPKLKALR